MSRTTLGTLGWVAAIAAPIGWSIGRIYDAAVGTLLPVPWVLPLLLVFLAVIAVAAAAVVRAWVAERRYDNRIDALRVARLLVLAKALEFFGAAVAGAYLGLVLLALDAMAVPMGRNRVLLGGIVVVAAVVLTVAAVRLERACIAPPSPDEDDESRGQPSSA